MESDSTLEVVYKRALASIDDIFRYTIDPMDTELSSLVIALQRLAHTIKNDFVFLQYLSDPRYSKPFEELCSTSAGQEAVKAMATALIDATGIFQQGKKACGLQQLSHDNAQSRVPTSVKLTVKIVEGHETLLKEHSNKLLVMFNNSTTLFSYLSNDKMEQLASCKEVEEILLRRLKDAPFALKATWKEIGSLSQVEVINHPRISVIYTDGSSIRHPFFRRTAELGTSWVEDQLRTLEQNKSQQVKATAGHRHLHEVSLGLLNRVHRFVTDASDFRIEDSEWSDSFVPISTCLGSVIETLDYTTASKQVPRRYAVCGPVSAGKSSVINALIGENFLPEHARPCTGWPTIIKHNEHCTRPTLKVDRSHFQPFIDQLRQWYKVHRLSSADETPSPSRNPVSKFSSGLDTFEQTLEIPNPLIMKKYSRLLDELKKRLEDIQEPSFELPETSVGQPYVEKTSQAISDIIRLAYTLLPPGEVPTPEGKEFPVLSYDLRGHGKSFLDTEFVDLPGFGDVNIPAVGLLLRVILDGMRLKNLKVDIEEIYNAIMPTCHGTIIVVRASNSIIGSEGFEGPIQRINRLTKGLPRVVIGTGSDTHHAIDNEDDDDDDDDDNDVVSESSTPGACLQAYKGWEDDDTRELIKVVFDAYSDDARNRVKFCSPPLYQSCRYMLEKLDRKKQDNTKLNFKQLNKSPGSMCISIIFGGDVKYVKELGDEGLESSIRRWLPKTGIQELPTFLLNTLHLEGTDRIYMEGMKQLRQSLENLCIEQQTILFASSCNAGLLAKAMDEYQTFMKTADGHLSKWGIEGVPFLTEIEATLECKLEEIQKKANSEIASAIENVRQRKGYNSFQDDHGLFKMKFQDRAEALMFLIDIETQVKSRLNTLQDSFVSSVREIARSAWRSRIQRLADFFKQMQPDERFGSLDKGLQDHILGVNNELVLKLEEKSHEDIAISLASLVTEKLADQKQPGRVLRFLKDIVNPWKPRQEASEWARQALKAKREGKVVQASNAMNPSFVEELTETSGMNSVPGPRASGLFSLGSGRTLSKAAAEELHSRAVNYLGFLVRTPVLASAAQCPITTKLWYFLKKPKLESLSGISSKEIPFEVPLALFIENYQKYVVDGWHSIIDTEAHTSLSGAIWLSEGIARKTFNDAILKHRERLQEAMERIKRPLKARDTSTLILMQADSTAAYGAADRVFQHFSGTVAPSSISRNL